jgi:hypothetical protein
LEPEVKKIQILIGVIGMTNLAPSRFPKCRMSTVLVVRNTEEMERGKCGAAEKFFVQRTYWITGLATNR